MSPDKAAELRRETEAKKRRKSVKRKAAFLRAHDRAHGPCPAGDDVKAPDALLLAAVNVVNEYRSHGGSGTHQECMPGCGCFLPMFVDTLAAALVANDIEPLPKTVPGGVTNWLRLEAAFPDVLAKYANIHAGPEE